MKTLKIIGLIVWAILTIGILVYNQFLTNSISIEKDKIQYLEEEINVLYEEGMSQNDFVINAQSEYYINMMLLRKDTLRKINIDSLANNSPYLIKISKGHQEENSNGR